MEENTEVMTVDSISNRVYIIRGQQVMLDYDLAELYGYEVKALNQQVKRNIGRFPEDFMFQLKKEEIPEEFLKSQIVTLNESGNKRGFLTTAVVNDFVQQYPSLRIKPNPDCHDRLIVLDYGLPTEQAYHCGASSKDAGKKLCAINTIADTSMIHPVIDKLLLAPDKKI